jgi:hypothetical protein
VLADGPFAICYACEQPLQDGEARYRTPRGDIHVQCRRREARILVVEDDSAFPELMEGVVKRVDDLSDSPAAGREIRPRVLGRSLTHGAFPTPAEPERGSEDESLDPQHESTRCSCLTCAVDRAGKTPTYIVLNSTPEEEPIPAAEQVAYVIFCAARVLLLGLGAVLTVAVSATFVH